MDQNYRQLMEFLLPQGILEYFDLIKTTQSPNGLHIYLEEKIEPPTAYSDRKLHSKGFLPEVRVQDFPIRENKVTLVIKRRRWEDVQTNEIITRDWDVVSDGARITKEFGLFLKETLGRKPR
ncbi:transposase [Chitinophaga sancti]|uniref:Transposase n=2 Tax=Chitinophaga sancti TaxID=1004 RepID=A0ABZ0XJ91_9BACT|nr:transposase [Chitinophaga sancti]WQD63835.1 transposase [Chitinophaga sancti]WQG90540.1 transposase [Chitinophaga sancti]